MKKDLEKIKKTYKISDLMAKVKVTARTIRYYDSEGLLGDVKRSVGYTRYFTDSDVKRIKEVIKLKKKGHKISEIKEIFKEKYQTDANNTFPNLAFSDVYITENDISLAQELDIEILSTEIGGKQIKAPYFQWKSFDIQSGDSKFELSSTSKSNRTYQWTTEKQSNEVTNTPSGLFKYISKNFTKDLCNENKIIQLSKQSFNWLIIPVNIQVDNHELSDLYYFVKYTTPEKAEENIWKASTLLPNIEKQIKEALSPFQGIMNQITIHSNQNDKKSKEIVKAFKIIFPNSSILDIEEMTPFYRKVSGNDSAILLSII